MVIQSSVIHSLTKYILLIQIEESEQQHQNRRRQRIARRALNNGLSTVVQSMLVIILIE